jgi:hypothetical protein
MHAPGGRAGGSATRVSRDMANKQNSSTALAGGGGVKTVSLMSEWRLHHLSAKRHSSLKRSAVVECARLHQVAPTALLPMGACLQIGRQ